MLWAIHSHQTPSFSKRRTGVFPYLFASRATSVLWLYSSLANVEAFDDIEAPVDSLLKSKPFVSLVTLAFVPLKGLISNDMTHDTLPAYLQILKDHPRPILEDCPFPSPWQRSASSETAENYMLDLDSPASTLLSVCPRQFGIHYDIDHCMGSLAQSPSEHLVNTNKPRAVREAPGFFHGKVPCTFWRTRMVQRFLALFLTCLQAYPNTSSVAQRDQLSGIQSYVARHWHPSQAKVRNGKTFGCLKNMLEPQDLPFGAERRARNSSPLWRMPTNLRITTTPGHPCSLKLHDAWWCFMCSKQRRHL